MAKRRKSTSRSFLLGMMIYALIFVVFLSIGLRLFWVYIDNFEKSQPVHAIDRYMASFDREHIRALSADFVSTLDGNLQSDEDAYGVIEQLFENLHYSKKSAESTDDHLVYAILAGDRYLGSMTLDATGEKGGDSWQVTSESFDFSDLVSEQSFIVPEEWTVRCGGNLLDESYITESDIEYPTMEEAYDYGFALPMLVKYELGNYVGSPEIQAFDKDGNPAQIQEDPTAYTLTDRCTAEQRERLTDFTNRFLPLYIAFMSNTNHNAYDNYARVHPYLLPGSDLETRFYSAIAGQTYSHSKGDYLHDIVVHGVFDLGGATFLIDVDYKVDTTGNAGTIANDAGMLIVAEDHGADGMFASELFIK